MAISMWQLPVAAGALTGLTLVVTPTSTQTAFGSNPSNINVDVTFISTEAAGEHLKLSANIVSVPAGQNVQATIAQVASSNATLEMFDSTSHIKAINAGVVNAKFAVSVKSATVNPLAAGTYSMLIFAGSNSGSQQQTVSFVVNPPPAPVLAPSLSRIWMTSGSTSANESNNTSSISGLATVDTKNQIANLTVDLRDTNNLQINNLPITVSVTGPGLIGIGSSASTNSAMGRAVLGQPGQYSISVYADGTYGASTIMIYQNGQLIGSRSIIFTQPISEPASVFISDVSISAMTANAGESIKIQFTSKTTSLATGQEAYVSINSYEDCEVEGCSVGGLANLLSGDSSNGTWLSSLTIPSTAVSGEYTVSIYFPKLKGVNGFYYRHLTRITVKGVASTPPAPTPSIALGQVTLNKNEFKVGETLIIRIPVKTFNLPTDLLLNATIFAGEDCEESNCSSSGTGKLVSGNLQDGVWEIVIPINQGMYSGLYSLNYGFFKLKGVSGAIGPLQINIAKIVGVEPPPPAPAIALQISNIITNLNSLSAGQAITVSFEVMGTNLDSSQIAQVYLFPINGDDSCEEGCGLGYAKLVKGNYSQGVWLANVEVPAATRSGNYQLRVMFPKLKGVSGFYSDYKTQIFIKSTANENYIQPYYEFSALRSSAKELKSGQLLEGYFYLKTNDSKVSTPACIIDGATGWTSASRISGSALSGEWVCKILVPTNALTGRYKFEVAVVGYANDNKNEQWAMISDLYILGNNQYTNISQLECVNLLTNYMNTLKLAISDLSELSKYISNIDSLRTFFVGNTYTWKDIFDKLQTSWQQNLKRTESALVSVRASSTKGCDSYNDSRASFQNLTSELESIIRLIKDQNTKLNQWFQNVQIQYPNPQKYFNPQVEVGSIEIQKVLENTLGRANIYFAYQSNSGASKITCAVNVGNCLITQNSGQNSGDMFFGVAEIDGFPPGAIISISLKQFGPSGSQVASIQQPYTALRQGLQPKIGPVVSIPGGCTFKILNYDSSFKWFAKSSMKISNDGTAVINTLSATDEYISTSRNGYQLINALDTLFKCIPLAQNSSATSNNPVIPVEDDGIEETPFVDLAIKREASGKFLLTVVSNIIEEKLYIVALRKGKPTVRFNAITNEYGSAAIRTSRNLSGFSLKLTFNGETLATAKAK